MVESPKLGNENGLKRALSHAFNLVKTVKGFREDGLNNREKLEYLYEVVERSTFAKDFSRDGIATFLQKIASSEVLTSPEKKLLKYLEIVYPIKNWSEIHNAFDVRSEGVGTLLRFLDLTHLDLNTVTVEMGEGRAQQTITGKEILEDKLTYTGNIKFEINKGGNHVGVCDDCEYFNRIILSLDLINSQTKSSDDVQVLEEKGGVLLKLDGRVIGFMKMFGELSFLASRTVVSEAGGNIFIKGVVYSFVDFFYYFI